MSASIHVIPITDANFNEKILQSDLPVLLDFYATWCGPCKILSPVVEELAEEYQGKVLVGVVDVDSNPKLSEFFKIKSIPTLTFIKSQQLLEVVNGLVSKPNLKEMLEDLIAFEIVETAEEQKEG